MGNVSTKHDDSRNNEDEYQHTAKGNQYRSKVYLENNLLGLAPGLHKNNSPLLSHALLLQGFEFSFQLVSYSLFSFGPV